MKHRDKVLIVERVIDSLDLQGIRNSLVGTVEKRGISGGQGSVLMWALRW